MGVVAAAPERAVRFRGQRVPVAQRKADHARALQRRGRVAKEIAPQIPLAALVAQGAHIAARLDGRDREVVFLEEGVERLVAAAELAVVIVAPDAQRAVLHERQGMVVARAHAAHVFKILEQERLADEFILRAIDLPVAVVAPGVEAAVLQARQHEAVAGRDLRHVRQRHLRGSGLRVRMAETKLAQVVAAPGPQRSVRFQRGGEIAAGRHLHAAVHHLHGQAAVMALAVAELAVVVIAAHGVDAAVGGAEQGMIPPRRSLDHVFQFHRLHVVGRKGRTRTQAAVFARAPAPKRAVRVERERVAVAGLDEDRGLRRRGCLRCRGRLRQRAPGKRQQYGQ